MKRIIICLKNNKILALTILWLILGLAALITYWVIFKSVTWVVLTGFATWVLAGGVFLAFSQIHQARKSTNAQLAIGLFRELRSDKALEIFRYIYSLGPNEDGKNLTKTHKDNITYVLERFGMIALLVINGIVDEKLAIEAFCGISVLKCWYKMKYYIDEEQKHKGMHWGRYTEHFARRSLEFYKNYKEKWILYYRNIGDEPIDVVKELLSNEKLRPRFLWE